MLVLSRKPGQSITIKPGPELDETTPVGVMFDRGPIEVWINRINKEGVVSLGVEAHRQFAILRNELKPHAEPISEVIPANRSTRELLAQNVFALRVLRKLSAQQLADASHLALTTICAIESGLGLVDLTDLDNLAKVLGVSAARLLSE